jgi:hypothetical protein
MTNLEWANRFGRWPTSVADIGRRHRADHRQRQGGRRPARGQEASPGHLAAGIVIRRLKRLARSHDAQIYPSHEMTPFLSWKKAPEIETSALRARYPELPVMTQCP